MTLQQTANTIKVSKTLAEQYQNSLYLEAEVAKIKGTDAYDYLVMLDAFNKSLEKIGLTWSDFQRLKDYIS